LGQWGGFWRTRFQENREKFQRVWSEVEAQQKEGTRIQSAGAYAHDLWKRFV
jgi:hypothetical protein